MTVMHKESEVGLAEVYWTWTLKLNPNPKILILKPNPNT